ncbi:hypothetical protein [Methanoregula sp.]|uniref:hypothetical protein n=1 Tax=Methanoregula sp. TaxID=2052170 RepID=UPI002375F6D3|nr:hypothetical protein [Methanoregula sp.]MDD1686074.1 hypothetical protein [Methanoregula sp.]
MSGSTQSSLARLVLFMIILSLTGCIIAGSHYAAIDRPAQEKVQAALTGYNHCTSGCLRTNVVYISPTGPQNPGDDACMQKCRDEYLEK